MNFREKSSWQKPEEFQKQRFWTILFAPALFCLFFCYFLDPFLQLLLFILHSVLSTHSQLLFYPLFLFSVMHYNQFIINLVFPRVCLTVIFWYIYLSLFLSHKKSLKNWIKIFARPTSLKKTVLQKNLHEHYISKKKCLFHSQTTSVSCLWTQSSNSLLI